MDAADALDEIAFLLERELAEPFKIKAFRTASVTISGLLVGELALRAADGRLAKTKGIGGRGLEVIRQALDGEVPAYLQNLRDQPAASVSAAGRVLLTKLRGDLHTHSDWSDGTVSIEKMITAARSLGREYVAVTDHSPNLRVAHGLTAERLRDQLTLVERLDADSDDIRVLRGIEVDILETGDLDQQPDLLELLDVVVASVHSKLRADTATMTERMLAGIRHPATNILGHCTGRLVKGARGTRPPSDFDAKRVFAECASQNVAIEINSRPERQDPPTALIGLAIEAGCLFSIDSDAHAPGHLDFLGAGAERAVAAGVPLDRIITTWPVGRLLDWTRG